MTILGCGLADSYSSSSNRRLQADITPVESVPTKHFNKPDPKPQLQSIKKFVAIYKLYPALSCPFFMWSSFIWQS